jgi:alkylation response protein AidB-like acyl-CoA dehydrogenase
MDYDLGAEAGRLRIRLRDLVRENVPENYLGAFSDNPEDLEIAQRFCKVLAEEHLLALAWPEEFGGAGASVWEQTVVREEMWAHYEPRGAQYMGLNWVGPAIMRHGTPEQKAKYLPPIAAGEVIWCQGFSEPDAGSDLASLRTGAVADGDGWRLNGQKVWTSYALMADYCVVAARTGAPDSRHAGITLFLLPMDRPGLTAVPIPSQLGPHHLNELFLDDVRVEPGEAILPLNGGWKVMRDALAYERVGIARYARCDRLLTETRATLADDFEAAPPALLARYARAAVHARTARLLSYHTIAAQAEGEIVDSDAAAARVAVTRCDQEVGGVLMEMIGSGAFDGRKQAGAPLHGGIEDHYRYSQAATVAAGTLEMQLTLVARAALEAR